MKKISILLVFIYACSPGVQEKELKWYKGNTHSHTTLSGHADTHPDTVALWYLERNYNFLILSEHNLFIDPDHVHLPENRRKDFILIPGEEVSDHYEIHTTGMNVDHGVFTTRPIKLEEVPEGRFDNMKSHLIQKHVDTIRKTNGVPILNHPNWRSGASAAQIEQAENLHMIELYNGHPDVHNWGNSKHASMEVKWDSLLTAGKKIYGVSSDDAHFFKKWEEDESNPGRGWVMVQSDELTADAITHAMENGDFYASSGVMLKEVVKDKSNYSIEIDVDSSLDEIKSPLLVGHKTSKEAEGFSIEFIADDGKVIEKVNGTSAKINIPQGVQYVRAKITYSRALASESERFYAWTQPVFLFQ